MGKKKQSAHKKRTEILPFNIMNFGVNNYYLFNVTRYSKFINSIEDLNLIKPHEDEINIITDEIDNSKLKNSRKNNNHQRNITIKQEFYYRFKKKKKKDLSGRFIQKIYQKY